MRRAAIVALALSVFFLSLYALRRAWRHSKGRTHRARSSQDLEALLLSPGDVVLLEGDARYPPLELKTSGTAEHPITIRGVRVHGKRPVVSGHNQSSRYALSVRASHIVVEGVEVTEGRFACVFHQGDDLTIRDSEIHHCPSHGLLSADEGAGSLTLERVEVHHSGEGERRHQIYVATDERRYPGARFRMNRCSVHDGLGGNNVKSRAEHNEIRDNRIEGGHFHQLELIGPDLDSITDPREDSEIIGNTIIGNGHEKWHLVRVGGDEQATSTRGRYLFEGNTFVVDEAAPSVIRLAFEVESLSFTKNIFRRNSSGTTPIFDRVLSSGRPPEMTGAGNHVGEGFSEIPPSWSTTFRD